MDASRPLSHAAAACDVCGYPRLGLPVDSRCPECGEAPPVAEGGGREARAARRPEARTAASLAHARAVACGLLLLVVSSVSALSVTLYMDVGRMTVPALNVP